MKNTLPIVAGVVLVGAGISAYVFKDKLFAPTSPLTTAINTVVSPSKSTPEEALLVLQKMLSKNVETVLGTTTIALNQKQTGKGSFDMALNADMQGTQMALTAKFADFTTSGASQTKEMRAQTNLSTKYAVDFSQTASGDTAKVNLNGDANVDVWMDSATNTSYVRLNSLGFTGNVQGSGEALSGYKLVLEQLNTAYKSDIAPKLGKVIATVSTGSESELEMTKKIYELLTPENINLYKEEVKTYLDKPLLSFDQKEGNMYIATVDQQTICEMKAALESTKFYENKNSIAYNLANSINKEMCDSSSSSSAGSSEENIKFYMTLDKGIYTFGVYSFPQAPQNIKDFKVTFNNNEIISINLPFNPNTSFVYNNKKYQFLVTQPTQPGMTGNTTLVEFSGNVAKETSVNGMVNLNGYILKLNGSLSDKKAELSLTSDLFKGYLKGMLEWSEDKLAKKVTSTSTLQSDIDFDYPMLGKIKLLINGKLTAEQHEDNSVKVEFPKVDEYMTGNSVNLAAPTARP